MTPNSLLANLPPAGAAHDMWHSLLEILLLLGLAMVMGTVAERLRQSAIVGYLLAGAIVGPGVLGWVSNQQDIFQISELGVALLLFAIGLEFSPRRLWSMGRVALVAGPLQVLITMALAGGASWFLGASFSAAVVIGAIVALSSTACVLRLLEDRAELDSPYGRVSLGVLLVQDVAVVPLMLIVTILTTGGTTGEMASQLALSLVSAVVLIGAFYGLFNIVAPRLLRLKTWRRNRELPILLAVVMAMGSAWAAHHFGLSPAMGAFVAGVLLAISPFAVQVRADIEPIKTVLVTLFFAAVGMFADVGWLVANLPLVCGIMGAIVVGKALVVAGVTRLSGAPWQFAAAAGCCLAQVGEFSFVLATIAHGNGGENSLLGDDVFRAMVSATILSLLVTPYLIAVAPVAGGWLVARRGRRASATVADDVPEVGEQPHSRDLIFVIGFGPAGQRAAEDLLATHQQQLVVIDINPENLEIAQRYGLPTHLGDATRSEILEHAEISRANLVIITVPSPLTARKLIHLVRHHANEAIILARSRYHLHRWQLVHAGAHVVVDEEDRVGHELAGAALRALDEPAVE